MRVVALVVAMIGIGFGTGCSTRGKFVIPPGTRLELQNRPVDVQPDGTVQTRPFPWSAIGIPPGGGIRYRLLKNGQVVREGRLRSVFRGASLFWPPVAVAYWPVGLNPRITYDLVADEQK